MTRTVLIYGTILGILLTLFKVIEYTYFSYKISLETYLGIVALLFLVIGVYVGLKFTAKKTVEKIVYQPENTNLDLRSYEELGLSEREFEVLELLVEGYSNQEIADKLFISLSTIKTHLSNIYLKLDVKRRTQSISKAKELKIIL